jgi:hypothetical protein
MISGDFKLISGFEISLFPVEIRIEIYSLHQIFIDKKRIIDFDLKKKRTKLVYRSVISIRPIILICNRKDDIEIVKNIMVKFYLAVE